MRLIDADALKADIEQFNRPLCDGYHMKDYILNQIITDIENQPTIDAVPVVRCRECKYYFPEGHVRCWNIRGMHYPVEPEEFCSRGERKEE